MTSYADILTDASQVTPETLPDALQRLFVAMYDVALLDTEAEAVLQALRKAARVSIKALRGDWHKFRATREQRTTATPTPPPPEVQEQAEQLLRDPALLHKVITTIGQLGVEGEEENRGLLYVTFTSRLTETPISSLVKGRSSSGKNHLVDRTLALIPPEAVHRLTAMSAKALAYADDMDFRHTFIVIFEDAGLGDEAEYLMRTLLTEGCLEYLTVDKTAQGLKTRRISQPGPTGLVTTMTKALTREDNETRAWSLYMDDSKAHTLRVVQRQARAATGAETSPDTAPWLALQGLLEPIEVVIPWAETVAQLLETDALPRDITRLRRDFPRLLTLVKVITLLYQRQRPRDAAGQLLAMVDDYAMAYALVAEPFARSAHGISARALEVADAVREVYADKQTRTDPDKEVYVTIKDLAKALRWATRTVQKWVTQAEEGDLIDVQRGVPGTPLKMRPGTDNETATLALLPTPEHVAHAVGVSLTAIHPLTGVPISPMRACAPGQENSATPALSTPNEAPEARTDHAHPARVPQNNSGSPAKSDTSERAHPVRASVLPPLPVGETLDDQGHQNPCAETAHAGTFGETRASADSVRGVRGHARPAGDRSADETRCNGHATPDRAGAHGREASQPETAFRHFCPRCGEESTHVLASNGSARCVWCSLLPAAQVFHLHDPTNVEVF